jgi:hypothetical protein
MEKEETQKSYLEASKLRKYPILRDTKDVTCQGDSELDAMIKQTFNVKKPRRKSE